MAKKDRKVKNLKQCGKDFPKATDATSKAEGKEEGKTEGDPTKDKEAAGFSQTGATTGVPVKLIRVTVEKSINIENIRIEAALYKSLNEGLPLKQYQCPVFRVWGGAQISHNYLAGIVVIGGDEPMMYQLRDALAEVLSIDNKRILASIVTNDVYTPEELDKIVEEMC